MKLLIESIDAQNTETIIEEAEGKKSFYISGPMIMAETPNRNGRIYPSQIIEREVARLQEKIKMGRAAGELNHPSRPDVDPVNISHYITELHRDGNMWVGKAKIASTPMGNIVKGLLSDGYKLGVSTRGLGTVGSNGIVEKDFRLVCIDCVNDPSIGELMDPIVESIRYKLLEDGTITRDLEPMAEKFESQLAKLPRQDREKYIIDAVKNFLKGI